MHFVLLSNNYSHLSLLNIIPTESTVSSVLMWVCLGLDVKVRILLFSFVWGSNLRMWQLFTPLIHLYIGNVSTPFFVVTQICFTRISIHIQTMANMSVIILGISRVITS